MSNSRVLRVAVLAGGLLQMTVSAAPFIQTNLTSNIPGLAANTDANFRNPWGISFSATSPLWASNQATGTSTLYNGLGVAQGAPLIVTIPPSGTTPPQGPTGQVFNSAVPATSFVLSNGGKASFMFASLGGTISGWNGAAGTTALTMFTSTDHANYTGLAIGNNGSGDFLYAADFANGKIDTFNSSFAKVSPSGNFIDPTLPAGYAPYNVQNIGGTLYVEYALVDPVTHRASTTANHGIISTFNANGVFQGRLVTDANLDSPWGIALAPLGFGSLGGSLLVGNFGDGTISAFNPVTGAFLGKLSDAAGKPLVNSGIWGIGFHTATQGFDANSLYFVAGINNEADGLFGRITDAGLVPEPGTFALVSILGLGLFLARKYAYTMTEPRP